jgi:hypothetical protein
VSGYEPARPGWGIPQGSWHRPLGDQSPYTPPDPPAPVIEHQEAAPVLRFLRYEPTTVCPLCARAEDPRPALVQQLAPLAMPPVYSAMRAALGVSWYNEHRSLWLRDGDPIEIQRMVRHPLPVEAPAQIPLIRRRVIWAPGGQLAALGARQKFGLVVGLGNLVMMLWALASWDLTYLPVAAVGVAVGFLNWHQK